MRITRDTLLKIARDTAAQRVRTSRRVICIYLTGSLLAEEPLMGGTTDIDLICVHDGEPPMRREVVRLVDEVHLDIGHYAQADFSQPRHLRQDPWLGPFITSHPLLLHDSAHWFDFAQAAITAQFNNPENILARARALSDAARQAWLALRISDEMTPDQVWGYLKAVENAGNAFASLSGVPLTERRYWLVLPERAETLGRPGLAAGLLDLILPDPLPAEDWQAWQAPWRAALVAATQNPACPARLQSARHFYYERSAAALFETSPAASAWLALRTWTQAAMFLPGDGPDVHAWRAILGSIGLDSQGFSTRLDAFDAYLDNLEETLDAWGKANGIQ
jgi:hypothetical protein